MKNIQVKVDYCGTVRCARCYKHHYSVGEVKLYPDLCCVCAYDIHNGICINSHLFKKEGDL